MNISAGPIRRPILTMMVYLIIIILGLVSLARLAIDLMPEVTFPNITMFKKVTCYISDKLFQ
jgi:HAE1 family hydrophobic/amphiphilic exporter-1